MGSCPLDRIGAELALTGRGDNEADACGELAPANAVDAEVQVWTHAREVLAAWVPSATLVGRVGRLAPDARRPPHSSYRRTTLNDGAAPDEAVVQVGV